ncbi:AbrB/MazE/SpoVT family DNA-binding domain-containing protein [Natrarchaeobius sp. A-rgal3]|uniref:AbrB/MazE/SpoVT family DNA-binding domain-containing protein n=1 Tax=Natrarchaeobius versutus TaxID=1679078 RepID=UPI00350FF4B1
MATNSETNGHSRVEPVERKVQLTGGSTYTVSLPKAWADQQQIEAGCPVNLYPAEDQLVVTRRERTVEENPHDTSIAADKYDTVALVSTIESMYTAGRDLIRIERIDETAKRRAVTKAVRQFVGLEIVSESERRLVAKSLLDVEKLTPEQTLEQLKRASQEVHREAIEAIVGSGGSNIHVCRHIETIDRLCALHSRRFQWSSADPSTMANGDQTSHMVSYLVAVQLKRIAEHAARIAALADRFERSPDQDVPVTLEAFDESARALLDRAVSGVLERAANPGSVLVDANSLLAEIAPQDGRCDRTRGDGGSSLGLALEVIAHTITRCIDIVTAELREQYRID